MEPEVEQGREGKSKYQPGIMGEGETQASQLSRNTQTYGAHFELKRGVWQDGDPDSILSRIFHSLHNISLWIKHTIISMGGLGSELKFWGLLSM